MVVLYMAIQQVNSRLAMVAHVVLHAFLQVFTEVVAIGGGRDRVHVDARSKCYGAFRIEGINRRAEHSEGDDAPKGAHLLRFPKTRGTTLCSCM
jgi:hypothetical protein